MRPADPIFASYLAVREARERLQRAEQTLLDEWVHEAEDEAGDNETLTHKVAFEGHPAFLRDEPPSRPAS